MIRNISRFGLAVRHKAGKQRDLGSNLLRLSFLFKGCGLWPLSCDFVPHKYETLKWLSSLPTIMQKSFRWQQRNARYNYNFPPPPPPPPPSFMVSVNVIRTMFTYLIRNPSDKWVRVFVYMYTTFLFFAFLCGRCVCVMDPPSQIIYMQNAQ